MSSHAPQSHGYDVEAVRQDFPALGRLVHGKPLVYLDNAASSQAPQSVIDALELYYREYGANIHRGVHHLSQEATQLYEEARTKAQHFIGAKHLHEIIYVRGTTEAINLVAHAYGTSNLGEGDEILLSGLEHHSNIVPWQLLCERTGAKIVVVPLNERGEVTLDAFTERCTERTKIAAFAHASNALGTLLPVKEMVQAAHKVGAVTVIDGAQAVPHCSIDVVDLDCDFYAFSAHKMYGPTGMGILFGKEKYLLAMPPFHGGGEMIRSVTFEKSTYNVLPHKFEAGTPNIAGAYGLGAAMDYLERIGLEAIAAHEEALLKEATEKLLGVPGLKLVGTAQEKVAVCSFTLDAAHPHDVGTILDQNGVAVRTGHHCAQPVMDFFKIPATARASFSLYNTSEDIDRLVAALHKTVEIFAP